MLTKIREEFAKTPLAVTFGGVSALGSVVALAASLLPGLGTGKAAQIDKFSDNGPTLIALAAALSISTTAALLSRIIQAHSKISAYFGSILLAVISTLLIALTIKSQGAVFKDLNGSTTNAAIIYWSTVVIFFSINAETVFKDFAAYERANANPKETAEERAQGSLIMLSTITAGWLGAVWLGESQLVGGLI